jgi:hypothetical protein
VESALASRLTPEECRSTLARELPPPPRLRYRFDGKPMIAAVSHRDGTLTVWNVPSGFASPFRVVDIRISPADGGSALEVTSRFAWSRFLVSALLVPLLGALFLVAIANLLPAPSSPASSAPPSAAVPLLALLAVLAVVLLLISRHYARQRKAVDEDQVIARLRELLRAG